MIEKFPDYFEDDSKNTKYLSKREDTIKQVKNKAVTIRQNNLSTINPSKNTSNEDKTNQKGIKNKKRGRYSSFNNYDEIGINRN